MIISLQCCDLFKYLWWTVSNASFLYPDSGPPALLSKSKQLVASSSTPTPTEASACAPACAPAEAPPSPPAPSSPAPAPPPEPAHVETASEDLDVPQAEDKRDTAESEVSRLPCSVSPPVWWFWFDLEVKSQFCGRTDMLEDTALI